MKLIRAFPRAESAAVNLFEVEAHGDVEELDCASGIEFVLNVCLVGFHGFRAYAELPGDGPRRQTTRKPQEDLALPRREGAVAVSQRVELGEATADTGIEDEP